MAPLRSARFLLIAPRPSWPRDLLALRRARLQSWLEGAFEAVATLVVAAPLLAALVMLVVALPYAMAAPGLCVGPVCGDEISRSPQYDWQLRLRVNDQQGHRERLVVDCRNGGISPRQGLVERGYAGAVARRACRLVGKEPA